MGWENERKKYPRRSFYKGEDITGFTVKEGLGGIEDKDGEGQCCAKKEKK